MILLGLFVVPVEISWRSKSQLFVSSNRMDYCSPWIIGDWLRSRRRAVRFLIVWLRRKKSPQNGHVSLQQQLNRVGANTSQFVLPPALNHDLMKTREDVVAAIRNLLVDLKENPDSWENPTLERYLDAMAAWVESSGKKHNQPLTWDLVVEMFEAAKIYE